MAGHEIQPIESSVSWLPWLQSEELTISPAQPIQSFYRNGDAVHESCWGHKEYEIAIMLYATPYIKSCNDELRFWYWQPFELNKNKNTRGRNYTRLYSNTHRHFAMPQTSHLYWQKHGRQTKLLCHIKSTTNISIIFKPNLSHDAFNL